MTDQMRARINDLVDGLANIPAEIRVLGRQDEDEEAYEILRRIEKRLQRTQAIAVK